MVDRAALQSEPGGPFGLVADSAEAGHLGEASSIPAAAAVDRARADRALFGSLDLQGALVAVCLFIMALILLSAILPAALAPYRPTDMQSQAILSPPGWHHLLGTDQFGRDVLSLVIYGARQSLALAFFGTVVSCSVGVFIGLTAGYAGGPLDMAAMRLIDMWMAIPAILLAIAVHTALGPSLSTTILAVSAALTPRYARVVRAQAIALRSRGYIEAARASGASHVAIIRRHLLPHCAGPILVIATIGAGWSILIGSSLSFLGFGVNDDCPDWAYLVAEGRGYVSVAWWTVTFPGLAITAFVVATNLLGDALRRRVDARAAKG